MSNFRAPPRFCLPRMSALLPQYPELRPVEIATRTPDQRWVLRDPTGLAQGALVVGETQVFLLSLLDGRRSHRDIRMEFLRATGTLLRPADLDGLLEHLEGCGFLQGPASEARYRRLADAYLAGPYRPLRSPEAFGAAPAELPGLLDRILASAEGEAGSALEGRASLLALVAPHLDFPRGAACYGAAYQWLQRLPAGRAPRRVVILGTNHFGRSRSVVATTKDFQTPWGVLRTDGRLIRAIEADCGGTLRPFELDHLREHSIELHAVWLHHLLGDGIEIVPFLCPDPNAPQSSVPGDPRGVELREFALALGARLRSDAVPTLLIASADLSHIGRYFGDSRPLDAQFLEEVRRADAAALDLVAAGQPEEFRHHMLRTQNPTRHCSVGCLYALLTALEPEARAHRLCYHQAVTPEMQNGVTCAAFAFTQPRSS